MFLRNGWTAGQYAVFRVLLGIYLFVHFVSLIPFGAELFSDRGALARATASPLAFLFPNVLTLYDSPGFVRGILATAVALSGLLIAGFYDRWAALGLWYLWACLFGRNPLIANPSLPFVGWILVAHALIPPTRRDPLEATTPEGASYIPHAIYGAAWVLMSVAYSYSGLAKLSSLSWLDGTAVTRVLGNPLARPGLPRDVVLLLPETLLRLLSWGVLGLELLFAPLALSRRLRPWLWTAMLVMHVSLVMLFDFADLSVGMIMMHVFTFDPSWIRPMPGAGKGTLFYDGGCGLCQRTIRFILAEDQDGSAFAFSPLGGELFQAVVPEAARVSLPDSLVVRTAEGHLLTRWQATREILDRLGGLWRVTSAFARLIPAWVGDRLYDAVARTRKRLFQQAPAACPPLALHLRRRFQP